MNSTIVSPKLKVSEIKAFRDRMCRLSSNNLTKEEKSIKERRIINMKRVAQMIESKNDGKNPILGY